jgi:hypothetical protein
MGKKINELTAVAAAAADLLELSRLSPTVTITASTISAAAADNSYNDSGSGFVAAGFTVGMSVKVAGFTGNVANNIFTGRITALTTGKMTIGGTDGDVIVDDAAGESVTITAWESRRTTAQAVADLGDEHYEVDGTPASDDTWGGRAITGVNAGATIAQWEAVYMGSGGEWLLADATDDTTAPAHGIAVAAGTDGNPMTVLPEGIVRNDAWDWTPGGAIFLSTTPGALTQTAPSSTGEIVQRIGWAVSADVAYISIGAATFIEVA